MKAISSCFSVTLRNPTYGWTERNSSSSDFPEKEMCVFSWAGSFLLFFILFPLQQTFFRKQKKNLTGKVEVVQAEKAQKEVFP